MSADLVEFLLARIAEDEEVAQEATPGPWWNESGTVHAPLPFGRNDHRPGPACHPLNAQGSNGRDSWTDAEHAARWDPARVLAECEAKRRVVEAARHTLFDDPLRRTDFWRGARDAVEGDLCFLALPYAGHPDYREEWKP